jgi:hypothetical protein
MAALDGLAQPDHAGNVEGFRRQVAPLIARYITGKTNRQLAAIITVAVTGVIVLSLLWRAL